MKLLIAIYVLLNASAVVFAWLWPENQSMTGKLALLGRTHHSVRANSALQAPGSLGRKTALVDFEAYSCSSTVQSVGYIKHWATRYQDDEQTVIGIRPPNLLLSQTVRIRRTAIRRISALR